MADTKTGAELQKIAGGMGLGRSTLIGNTGLSIPMPSGAKPLPTSSSSQATTNTPSSKKNG